MKNENGAPKDFTTGRAMWRVKMDGAGYAYADRVKPDGTLATEVEACAAAQKVWGGKAVSAELVQIGGE